MNPLDFQQKYWDGLAETRSFTHPLRMDRFQEIVPLDADILDFGCGYGRTAAFLKENGYQRIIGVDISGEMVARGMRANKGLDLRQIDGPALPFSDHTFDACTVLAVLNCITTDSGQLSVINEISRVLRPGAVLYLSDYPLQPDGRNTERYNRFKDTFGTFGIFQLPDGVVLRHHDIDWIHGILQKFDIIMEENIPVRTMNGNNAVIFQIMARKK